MFTKLAELFSEPKKDFWNDTILQNIDYSRYLLGHKYNVGKAGVAMGLEPATILKHDYTKFNPKMFDVYEDYFFGPEGIRSANTNPKLKKEFREWADWHYKQEDHHNDKIGKPENIETEMESVADWYSVQRTNAKIKHNADFPDFKTWWNENKGNFLQKRQISERAFAKIENQVNKDYNLFTYMFNRS
jgi:hypothetical protein